MSQNLKKFFLQPRNALHRQYEALRAFFVGGLQSGQAARQFGYTPGSFRVLCHQFRQNPQRQFFLTSARGPKEAPKRDPLRERVVALRKENLSIYDIARVLKNDNRRLSPVSISVILKAEGFARLPRRRDEERLPGRRPVIAQVADVRQLDLTCRNFRTSFGGLFLFVPYLAQVPIGRLVSDAGLPGSEMIPAAHAMRSLLGLKLFGSARHSHVMSYVLDEGLALFAGLNVIPKRSFLTEYSCRIHPDAHPKLMAGWFGAVRQLGLQCGESFDLDFHTIPFQGQDALVEKHYVTKRSRRQKGILAFLAQDADNRVFCYVNGELRKEETADEILVFAKYWKERTGKVPAEVIFDSRLTTQANLNKLNSMQVDFITLRRRSEKMLAEIYGTPDSAWRQIHLQGVSRIYRTPRIIDQRISLADYTGAIRQIIIKDLGHEEPTVLLTNQLKRSAPALVERYARRMIIENGIADAIDFFHMDALSSAVAMKVNCDLILTLMASSLYRLLGSRIGNGYQVAKSRHIFRDIVEATALVSITEKEILVKFQKRAHNPLLLAAGFAETDVRVPWLGGKHLRILLG